MPLFFAHGEVDQLMPVSEMLDLQNRLGERTCAVFRVVPNGDHNSPGALFCEILEYLESTLGEAAEKNEKLGK